MGSLKDLIRKNKGLLIVEFIIFLVAVVFLVSPIAVSVAEATNEQGIMNFQKFGGDLIPNIASLGCIGRVFSSALSMGLFLKYSGIAFLLYVCFAGYGLYKAKPKSEYDGKEHGSSDWSQNGEQYKVLNKKEGILLAEDNYLPVDKIGNINVLVVAGSGSGKTASFAIPNAYQALGSYIFTDPKGEIYDRTAGYLKSKGYEIKTLNLVNPSHSDSYNPLFHIKSEIDVDIIASTIIKGQKTEGSGADPYWDNMAELLLKALIFYLISARPPEERNLASCAELVRAANSNGDSNLLTELMSELPYDSPARMNYKSVELASDKTFSSILSTLQSKLGKFDSQEIADVTSTDTINFEELTNKPTALYVISSDTHTAYDFLLTIFFSQMIQQMYDYADRIGGALPTRTFFILDEFANIGQIPDFDKKISTSRSRNISFSVILQNIDQLEAVYEKSYETIMGNCDTHVFLGSNSYSTVEYFSKNLGAKTISHKSKSVNRDKKAAKTGFSESDQIMERALMTPDELRRMDQNDCIIFEKGIKPIKAKKFWWFKKKNMIEDFDKAVLDHNQYVGEGRGEWRKFNPNNPYQDSAGSMSRGGQDLKIESLDDLFDEVDEKPVESPKITPIAVTEGNGSGGNVTLQAQATQAANMAQTNMKMAQRKEEKAAAIAAQKAEEAKRAQEAQAKIEEDELDIQKELEAKFDELFGPSPNK